jgi:CRP/FNR family transcriptional regulator, anaerobic regulatory protein
MAQRKRAERKPPETRCNDCPLRGLKAFRAFSSSELAFVEDFKLHEEIVAPGQTVLIEGEKSPYLYTVLSGWLFKYKMLDDGRRQILNYSMRGDLLGLQSAVLEKMQHSVEALTETTLCVFPKEKIWSLYKDHHALGFDLTWIAAQEKAILADFLVSVGQRTATERIAFLLLALYRRAQSVGMARRGEVEFPFTQEHFADTIGFSLVHTNKRLRLLKRSGAFEWSGPKFSLLDEQKLVELACDPCRLPGSRPFV